jgi:cytochrome b
MTTALVHEPVTKPPLAACHPGELVRVYVWQWPVRMTHWATAYAILFLAATGLYLGHPFITVPGPAGQHFVMGWAKTIHFYAAIVFALSVVSRVAWMFMGNRYSPWDKFIPASPRRRRGLWDSLRYYLFQLRQPPGFVGHNPLAGFTFTGYTNLKILGKGGPIVNAPFFFTGDLFHVVNSSKVTVQGLNINGRGFLGAGSYSAAINFANTSGTIKGNTITRWHQDYGSTPPYSPTNPTYGIIDSAGSVGKVTIQSNTV